MINYAALIYGVCPLCKKNCPSSPVFCLFCAESPPSLRGQVTALCFSQSDHLLLAGYESGLLELWQHNAVVGHKQVKKYTRNGLYNKAMCCLCVCCLFVCFRLQTAPSQRSAPCLMASLLSAT